MKRFSSKKDISTFSMSANWRETTPHPATRVTRSSHTTPVEQAPPQHHPSSQTRSGRAGCATAIGERVGLEQRTPDPLPQSPGDLRSLTANASNLFVCRLPRGHVLVPFSGLVVSRKHEQALLFVGLKCMQLGGVNPQERLDLTRRAIPHLKPYHFRWRAQE
jgi:hypothetical protein